MCICFICLHDCIKVVMWLWKCCLWTKQEQSLRLSIGSYSEPTRLSSDTKNSMFRCLIHLYAPSNSSSSLQSCYRKHESVKKRAYEARVREVEHSSFTPLMFAATGGMDHEATTFYKRLASLLSNKWKEHYAVVLGWIRCRLSFVYSVLLFNVFKEHDPLRGIISHLIQLISFNLRQG